MKLVLNFYGDTEGIETGSEHRLLAFIEIEKVKRRRGRVYARARTARLEPFDPETMSEKQ